MPNTTKQLTRPVEFHFYSEARIEARRGDASTAQSLNSSSNSSSSTSKHAKLPPLPIPDFKALHAAHEQALAARREHAIAPTVPVPIPLSTETRAQERERFEAARRAREQEAEREREERRRLQAIEEEREIREIRRRAVPKAHEVPEWYAHAPRRTHDAPGT